MHIFTTALLQLRGSNIQQENLNKGIDFCRQAKSIDANIAVFPELWNVGYNIPSRNSNKDEWMKQAINMKDDFFMQFQSLAKEIDMAIALTYLEKWDGLPRNSVSVIDRFGEVVLTYAKVHTCDFDKEALLTPGDDFFVCDLNTKSGNVKLGAMICYDREFPESARILMLKGAEVIIVPNACEMEMNRKAQLQARAYENMTAMALANYAGNECKGHSMAFDGIAFEGGGESVDGVSRDMLITEAGEDEEIVIAKIDMNKLRDYRQKETWGNAYRKPSVYKILLSDEVNEPFKRKDARR
ncbi:MAG: carbon-nitrogen hydrolase family protein [Ignavibacteriae bacterium]|nr:MAG: carbon-nitrogen hydrolase family protein [Ignavibacteriota bacterium]